MKFIKIESQGIIDPQAFVLIGASTKREDNTKIGFFGSGLKYSIAYLLRKQINFKVFAEYKEIKFEVEKTTFRDKEFGIICVDGIKTSLSTDMGIDWDPWFIIREIYCNAVDEGESKISIVDSDECTPIENKTVFYIEVNSDFQTVIDNWDSYISENRKDLFFYDNDFNKIFSGGKELTVYRKGIRCMNIPDVKCLFHYDMNWIVINESRIVKSEWDFKYALVKYLCECTDTKVINKILNNICDTYEATFYWDNWSYSMSNQWLECINKRTLVSYENGGFWKEEIEQSPSDYLLLPDKLVQGLKSRFGDDVRIIGDFDINNSGGGFKEIKSITPRQQSLLNDGYEFLKAAGYEIKYPVKIVDFVKKHRLGLALKETIYVSTKVFEMGRHEVVAVLIEEQEHLITNYADESREFQNHFIKKFINALEEKTGKYL